MLLSCIDIPSLVDQTEVKNLAFLDFISHMNVVGSVLLTLPPDYSSEHTDENENMKRLADGKVCLLDGLTIAQDAAATKMLDAGYQVIFLDIIPPEGEVIDYEALREILKTFPRTRIGLNLPNDPKLAAKLISDYRDLIGHFLYKLKDAGTEDEDYSSTVKAVKELQASADYSFQCYFRFHPDVSDMEAVVTLATMNDPSMNAVIYPKVRNNNIITETESEDKFDFLDTFLACLKTDRPDGMFTTVVCDPQGVCLGLVYSNKESIRAAFLERKGIYWSRSRNSLWRKGDTSGMYQELLGLSYDCDRDALRFMVIQHGEPAAFCHLMTRTCWGPERGLQKLETLMKERLKSAPQGSYTKRLFDDPSLLRKKLLEEVQELVEAEEPDHIAAEAADVIYFLMARCAAGGVGLADIERHLDKRSLKVSRRPGNAKAWRTKDAEDALATAS